MANQTVDGPMAYARMLRRGTAVRRDASRRAACSGPTRRSGTGLLAVQCGNGLLRFAVSVAPVATMCHHVRRQEG